MWEKGYYVYMLLCENGSFYIGSAKEPQKRFALHQKGMGAKFTRANKPIKMIYLEALDSWSLALKHEFLLKKLGHKEKSKLLASDKNLILQDEGGK